MKKNYLRQISCLGRMALKWWLCLLLGGMLNLPATAQQKTAPRVNLKVEKTSLIRAIEALRSQTRYNFLFNSKDLQPYTDISAKTLPGLWYQVGILKGGLIDVYFIIHLIWQYHIKFLECVYCLQQS